MKFSELLKSKVITESVDYIVNTKFSKEFQSWLDDSMGEIQDTRNVTFYNNKAGETVFVIDKTTGMLQIQQRGLTIDQLKAYGLKVKEEINYNNLVRYIPTGSKVITQLTEKSMEITIVEQISAPPLTTKDIQNIEKRMIRDVDSFIGDIEKVINIKEVSKEPYIFMQGVNRAINFSFGFRIVVGTKTEGNKLVELDKALESKKLTKLPVGE